MTGQSDLCPHTAQTAVPATRPHLAPFQRVKALAYWDAEINMSVLVTAGWPFKGHQQTTARRAAGSVHASGAARELKDD